MPRRSKKEQEINPNDRNNPLLDIGQENLFSKKDKDYLSIITEKDITKKVIKSLLRVPIFPNLLESTLNDLVAQYVLETKSYKVNLPDGTQQEHFMLDSKYGRLTFLDTLKNMKNVEMYEPVYTLKGFELLIPILILYSNTDENQLFNSTRSLLPSNKTLLREMDAVLFDGFNWALPLEWADLPSPINKFFNRRFDPVVENGNYELTTAEKFNDKAASFTWQRRLVLDIAFRVFMADEYNINQFIQAKNKGEIQEEDPKLTEDLIDLNPLRYITVMKKEDQSEEQFHEELSASLLKILSGGGMNTKLSSIMAEATNEKSVYTHPLTIDLMKRFNYTRDLVQKEVEKAIGLFFAETQVLQSYRDNPKEWEE